MTKTTGSVLVCLPCQDSGHDDHYDHDDKDREVCACASFLPRKWSRRRPFFLSCFENDHDQDRELGLLTKREEMTTKEVA